MDSYQTPTLSRIIKRFGGIPDPQRLRLYFPIGVDEQGNLHELDLSVCRPWSRRRLRRLEAALEYLIPPVGRLG